MTAFDEILQDYGKNPEHIKHLKELIEKDEKELARDEHDFSGRQEEWLKRIERQNEHLRLKRADIDRKKEILKKINEHTAEYRCKDCGTRISYKQFKNASCYFECPCGSTLKRYEKIEKHEAS